MQFSVFAAKLEELEQLSSRLDMTERLAQLYTELTVDEIAPASYLMQGSLVPSYQSLEFQLSTKMLLRALARAQSSQPQAQTTENLFGEEDVRSTQKQVEEHYKKVGDLGEVAVAWIPKRNASHSLLEIYEALVTIAKYAGSGSQDQKVSGVVKLLNTVDQLSAKFIIRIILGKVRLGFSAMTLLDALSWAVTGDKSQRAILEQAYQKQADIGLLATTYLSVKKDSQKNPEKVLAAYSVTAGIPVIPALCHRLNTSQEIIDKMGEVIVEPKYDGLRVQIHFKRAGFQDGSLVKAYTRNLEDVSYMFPELLELEKVTSEDVLILDSEAIGFNPSTNELLPFQETITRKRKHNITTVSEKVPIKFFVFDILFRENNGFLEYPLRKRKDVLESLFIKNRTFEVAPFIITKDPVILREYHEEQLLKGLEGAVIKKIDSEYQSGRKGWKWVKIKEEEGTSGKLKDTLDLIIMGYYAGRGKRSQFGIGALLVGVLDAEESVTTIAKIGTGLTEQRLTDIKSQCDEIAVPQKPTQYIVDTSLIPDVWVDPSIVIEVAADEITKSPNHSSGVALRFPRLISMRTDKKWTDATTVSELATL